MKVRLPWSITFAVCLWATAAYGDGGALLLQKEAGPFTITLYATHVPLTTGVADISVIVQQRETGEVLLDPVVDLTAGEQTVRLTRGNAANRFMQAGEVNLPRAGTLRLNVVVRHRQDVARASADCMVVPNRSRAAIVWFYALLPVVVVLIFLLHQFLKRKQTPSTLGETW